ncbi:SMI1/KNR4 family protein [Actinoplanes sp. NPDC049548]|uniref:SMI1/KNR4 family protein n=1 Tax=Actinoplanes sp. NPDC049548 TaxID=3155152 RepID=UPI0034184393
MLAVPWRDVVLAVLPSAGLAAGASPAAIAAAQERLGQVLPEDLGELLAETDGVRDEDGVDVVWPVHRIVRDDLESGGLLFFGGNGEGDRFAFDPGDPARGVVVRDHKTGELRTVADGLADYLIRILAAGT